MQATNHEVFSAWPFTEQVYHAWFRVREAYTISQVKPCRIGLMSSWARVRMVFSVTQLNQGRAGDRTWVWHSYRCICHPPRAREWSGTIPFDFRLRFRFNLSLTKLSVKIQLWSNSWLSNSRLRGLLLTPSCLVGDAMDRTALKSPLGPLEAHRHILSTLGAHRILLINTWALSAIVPQLCRLPIPVPQEPAAFLSPLPHLETLTSSMLDSICIAFFFPGWDSFVL